IKGTYEIRRNNPDDSIVITGRPDPAGGITCGPLDDGQPHNNPPYSPGYSETISSTCSGSYQAGKFTYIQMILAYQQHGPDYTCTADFTNHWTFTFQGTFTSPTTIEGTVISARDAVPYNCTNVGATTYPAENNPGAWTGTVTTSA